jgi:transcriptional regulator with XRE-family HTH domain
MLEKLDAALARRQAVRELPTPSRRRELRERLGLTQAELAEAGEWTRPTISRWESGIREPRGHDAATYLAILRRLSAELGEPL